VSLVTDVGTYLESASTALTIATSSAAGNLYLLPFPKNASDSAVCLVEFSAGLPVTAMTSSLGSPVAERRGLQLMVREARDGYQTAETLAQTIYELLDRIGEVTMAASTTRYLDIEATSMPFYLGVDDNERHRFVCSFTVLKERSA